MSRDNLVEKSPSIVMCKSRIEGPGASYRLMKVPYILWFTTGALVSLTLTVHNLNVVVFLCNL